MSACRQNCDQGRRCDCREFLTPGENRKVWTTLAIFAVADIAIIALILWGLG